MAEKSEPVSRQVEALRISAGIRELEMRVRPSQEQVSNFSKEFISIIGSMDREERLKVCRQTLCEPLTRPTLATFEIVSQLGKEVMDYLADSNDWDGRETLGSQLYSQIKAAIPRGRHRVPGFLSEFVRREQQSTAQPKVNLGYDGQSDAVFDELLRNYRYNLAILKEDMSSSSGMHLHGMSALDYPITSIIDESRDMLIANRDLGPRFRYDPEETDRKFTEFYRLAGAVDALISGTSSEMVGQIKAASSREGDPRLRDLAATRLLRDAVRMIGRDDLELAYAVVHRMGSDQSISFTQPLLGRGHRHNTEPPVATPVYKIGDNEYGDDQQLGNLRQWHLRKPDYLADVLIPMLRQ